jgi:Zn-dependent protease
MFLRVSWDGTPPATAAAIGVAGAGLLLASVLAHELGHALTARRVGVTVQGVSLFLFGGYTEMLGEPEDASADLKVALAGPAASLTVAAVFGLVRWPLIEALPGAADVLSLLFVINLAAVGFNLLPGLPLDGGRILRALLWRATGDRAAAGRRAATSGEVLAATLVAGGIGASVLWASPLPLTALGVGWFLHAGAVAERRSGGLMGTAVELVMIAPASPVEPNAFVNAGSAWVPVVGEGRVVGLVPPRKLGTASDVMVLLEPDDVVDAAAPVGEALARVERTGRYLVVVADGRMVGVLTRERLTHWLTERRSEAD